MDKTTRNELIKTYYLKGYTNDEIAWLLQHRHGVILSVRQIRRLYRKLGFRRVQNVSIDLAITLLQLEMSESGSCLGSRTMSKRILSKYGVVVPRDIILDLTRILDPQGILDRRNHRFRRRQYTNKGPNYLIHIDGYDKLKPYGLAIHGAICGYSRKILWLKAAHSNNDPKIVAGYFLEYVNEIEGVPRCIRMDAGTENITVADMQRAFRSAHLDSMAGLFSVIIGSSHHNQRIERYWRSLRESMANHWINHFKDLEFSGAFSPANELHKEYVRFSFMKILQKELDRCSEEWNNHFVRGSEPRGKPNMMYHNPECFGTTDYKHAVSEEDVSSLLRYTAGPRVNGCHDDLGNLLHTRMVQCGKRPPTTFQQATDLFLWLVNPE